MSQIHFFLSAKILWTCPSCKAGRVAKAEVAKMEVDEVLEDEILEDESLGNEKNQQFLLLTCYKES